MATLTDVINQVIEDTGRYDLNDSATLKANLVADSQKFLQDYLTNDTMLTYSKQALLTAGVYGASIDKCQSLTKAWVSETGSFRNDLCIVRLEDLLSYANSPLTTTSRGIPEYIALGNADDTVFSDEFLASTNSTGFVVFPVPDRTLVIRLSGDFLPADLTDLSPSTHLFLSTYRHLFVLACKAMLEFGLRNMEGYNQFKGEMLERIRQLDIQNIKTAWANTDVMEA